MEQRKTSSKKKKNIIERYQMCNYILIQHILAKYQVVITTEHKCNV